jgi:hypothetical protein
MKTFRTTSEPGNGNDVKHCTDDLLDKTIQRSGVKKNFFTVVIISLQ